MSEANPDHFEVKTAPELDKEDLENEKPEEVLKTDHRKETELNVDEARQEVLEQPPVPLELPVDDSAEGNQPQYIDKAMKAVSLKNELSSIRQKLPTGQRLLSQFVHQPGIRTVSQIGAKTVSRPSGLLAGGILAFCGSLIYLLLTKYVGIRYNYFVSILLFISGFVVGILIEVVAKLVTKKQKR